MRPYDKLYILYIIQERQKQENKKLFGAIIIHPIKIGDKNRD